MTEEFHRIRRLPPYVFAECLTAWILAPGEVSVEFASEVAADLGTLTAGLHRALAKRAWRAGPGAA